MGLQFYEVKVESNIMSSAFNDPFQWHDVEEGSTPGNNTDSFVPIPLAERGENSDCDDDSDIKLPCNMKGEVDSGSDNVNDEDSLYDTHQSDEKHYDDDGCSSVFMPQQLEDISEQSMHATRNLPVAFPPQNRENPVMATFNPSEGYYQMPNPYAHEFSYSSNSVVSHRDQQRQRALPAVSRRGRAIGRTSGNTICNAEYQLTNNGLQQPEAQLFQSPSQQYPLFCPQSHPQIPYISQTVAESEISGHQPPMSLMPPLQSTPNGQSQSPLHEAAKVNQTQPMMLRHPIHPSIPEQMQRMAMIAPNSNMIQPSFWEPSLPVNLDTTTLHFSAAESGISLSATATHNQALNIHARSEHVSTAGALPVTGCESTTNEQELQHFTSANASLKASPLGVSKTATGGDENDEGDGHGDSQQQRLVLEEDRCLLTDYNFFMMKQLSLCRLTETDKKIRGGKRENINLGFPGLQCIHCAEAPNPRKFFWKNVDRLSNSFIEIPFHVLKCTHCPQQAKDALLRLKHIHHEQIAQLPRGSQKIFFRRVWRRMHSSCGGSTEKSTVAVRDDVKREKDSPKNNKKNEKAASTKKTVAAFGERGQKEETAIVVENLQAEDTQPIAEPLIESNGGGAFSAVSIRTVQDAAKALADSAKQSILSSSPPPLSPSQRVLLANPEDKKWLSDTDCFIRQQIEVFCATREDIENARLNCEVIPPQLYIGQIGVRCIHCALKSNNINSNQEDVAGADVVSVSSNSQSGSSNRRSFGVVYPRSIHGIYQAVRDIQRMHLTTCHNLPREVKLRLTSLNGCTSLSSFLRKYYVTAAMALGLKNTRRGIRPTGNPIALESQQSAVATSEESPQITSRPADESTQISVIPLSAQSRKRKAPFPTTAGSEPGKRPH